MKKDYLILAIDTSCDETSVAVTADDRVLANVISSQIKFHQKYGGVVPFLAQRMHREFIGPATEQALKKASLKLRSIDAIAVTVGPGLAPALEVGINFAKKLKTKDQRLIAVNHMEAHLLSSFAKNAKGNGPFAKTPPRFPILAVLVSGGHTQLVLMKAFGKYELLGETVDDAAGEAFDKVAKMLDLGYPGGPIISELAKKGKPIYDLPIPMLRSNDLNFSFSGLKTACLYKLQDLTTEKNKLGERFFYDFAASFETAVAEAIEVKFKKAVEKYQPKQIVLGGGVISNLTIRSQLRKTAKKYGLKTFVAYNKKLFTDNAAMVGVCGWYQAKRGDFVQDLVSLDRQPNLNF